MATRLGPNIGVPDARNTATAVVFDGLVIFMATMFLLQDIEWLGRGKFPALAAASL